MKNLLIIPAYGGTITNGKNKFMGVVAVQNSYSDLIPEILEYSELCKKNGKIDPELYNKYDVKRGLRDKNGKGVLTGLTEISEVNAFEVKDGKRVPIDGQLFYRGYNISDLVNGFINDKHFGFEEITYLLLFGELPNREQLRKFN